MQQCWSMLNVCILSVCTFRTGSQTGSVCLSMFECVYISLKRACDDSMCFFTGMDDCV